MRRSPWKCVLSEQTVRAESTHFLNLRVCSELRRSALVTCALAVARKWTTTDPERLLEGLTSSEEVEN